MAATFDGKTPNIGCSMKKSKVFNNNQKYRNEIDKRERSKNNNIPLPVYQTESLSSRNSTRRIQQKPSVHQSPQESGKLRRLEADEEQVYLITRNIHLALHTLLINAK
jgi:hypothetical protein